MKALVFSLAVALLAPAPALAHDLPVSSVTLRVGDAGIEADVEAPAVDLAHDLPDVAPNVLLTPAGAEAHKEKLASILLSRLVIEADGKPLRGELRGIEPLPEPKDVRLRLRFAGSAPFDELRVRCRLFPYDPRHKTFLNLYRNGVLERQAVFEGESDTLDYRVEGARQTTAAVVRTFVAEGVHHIFIGPDHILFIVGLLLLGGTVTRLLKIVTAFTVAHSLTLVLATLDLFNPPARFVEPAIALSIVFVGAHSLLLADRERRGDDARLLFAFGFGLLHGFGFAGVLRELDLPRYALGWSLFSFNVGVEIGQACIVLGVAPLHWRCCAGAATRAAGRVVTVGSLGVIAAGAFWFVQRVLA